MADDVSIYGLEVAYPENEYSTNSLLDVMGDKLSNQVQDNIRQLGVEKRCFIRPIEYYIGNDSNLENINFDAEPISDLSVNYNSICVPDTVGFIDQSIFTNNIVSWMWDFGDGGSSNIQNPTYEYVDAGLYVVSLSVIDDKGCESLVIINNLIEAKEPPVANFTSNIMISCDTSEIISFQNHSQYATNYYWEFGDGYVSTVQSPSHNYSPGLYDVNLIVDNGICTDVLIQNNFIEVGANFTNDFTSNINQSCKNDTIVFTDFTSHNVDFWLWDFGDGTTSNLQNPTHIFSNSAAILLIFNTALINSPKNISLVRNKKISEIIEKRG